MNREVIKKYLIKYLLEFITLCLLRLVFVLLTDVAFSDPIFWCVTIGLILLQVWLDYNEHKNKTAV